MRLAGKKKLGYFPLPLAEAERIWSEELGEVAVKIGAAHPSCDRECIVLVTVTILPRKSPAPKGWINLPYDRTSRRDLPAIERPKVHVGYVQADIAEPEQPGMGGLRNRAGHIEVKDRLRASSLLRYAPPPRASASSCDVAANAFAHEVNIGVIMVCRPMTLEIVEERRPIVR